MPSLTFSYCNLSQRIYYGFFEAGAEGQRGSTQLNGSSCCASEQPKRNCLRLRLYQHHQCTLMGWLVLGGFTTQLLPDSFQPIRRADLSSQAKPRAATNWLCSEQECGWTSALHLYTKKAWPLSQSFSKLGHLGHLCSKTNQSHFPPSAHH